MKLAKYKRYLKMAAWSERDIRYLPFVVIEREMSIEEARRRFSNSDWLIKKAEEISGVSPLTDDEFRQTYRSMYLGEWSTAARPSQSTDPTAPVAHTQPAAPPETA